MAHAVYMEINPSVEPGYNKPSDSAKITTAIEKMTRFMEKFRRSGQTGAQQASASGYNQGFEQSQGPRRQPQYPRDPNDTLCFRCGQSDYVQPNCTEAPLPHKEQNRLCQVDWNRHNTPASARQPDPLLSQQLRTLQQNLPAPIPVVLAAAVASGGLVDGVVKKIDDEIHMINVAESTLSYPVYIPKKEDSHLLMQVNTSKHGLSESA
ncbi:hypothetical protein N7488_011387 [Penicillium malachiteum]|nr:hypothetical protein N7488_011387 [Penicillium malachiteum]